MSSRIVASMCVLALLTVSGLTACSTDEPPSEFEAALLLPEGDVNPFLSLLNEVIDIEDSIAVLSDFARGLPAYNGFSELIPVDFEGRSVDIVYSNEKDPSRQIRLSIRSKDRALVQVACRQMQKFAAENTAAQAVSDCNPSMLEATEPAPRWLSR